MKQDEIGFTTIEAVLIIGILGAVFAAHTQLLLGGLSNIKNLQGRLLFSSHHLQCQTIYSTRSEDVYALCRGEDGGHFSFIYTGRKQ